MLDKGQTQTASEQSVAIQAGNNVTVNMSGMSYLEVRTLVEDTSKLIFNRLAGEARDTMRCRIEEITLNIIEKVFLNNPNAYEKAKDPDFQCALQTVLIEYGRHGDKDLGELLVDLISERSREEDRSLRQIVFNEAMTTASKVTHAQIMTLSLIYLLRHNNLPHVQNHEALGSFFDTHIKPFSRGFSANILTYQHLEFTRCGASGHNDLPLPTILKYYYPGLFQEGFSPEEIEKIDVRSEIKSKIFMPCLNNYSKQQLVFFDLPTLRNQLKKISATEPEISTLHHAFEDQMMANFDIKHLCCRIRPYMRPLFEMWEKFGTSTFGLTSVGMAIAHANCKRLIPGLAELKMD